MIKLPIIKREFGGYRTREDQQESKRRWCRNNKEQSYITGKNSRDNVRRDNIKIAMDAKSKPCTDCRVKFPYYLMDFDHVRGKKRNSMSRLLTKKAAFIKELAKCDVVCVMCHRRRTHLRLVAAGKTELI